MDKRNKQWAENLAREKYEEYASQYEIRDSRLRERLMPCLTRFYEGRFSGQKQTLREIVQDSGLGKTQFGRILRKLGEEPDFKTPRKKSLTSEQKKTLELAATTPFSNADISYFLNLNRGTVDSHYGKKRVIRGGLKKQRIIHFGTPEKNGGAGKGKQLTYSLASKILQRMDDGISGQEIMRTLGILDLVYDYVEENRVDIKHFITYFLRKIFPDKNPEKPYRTW